VKRILSALVAVFVFGMPDAIGQVENVPVNNQVYEFLDRLGIEGILPLYSNASIPMSRGEVAGYLRQAREAGRLSAVEQEYLSKFSREFAHELGLGHDGDEVLLGPLAGTPHSVGNRYADREKYLFALTDTTVSMFVEALGDIEFRKISGDTYGGTNATIGNIGGRIRGTVGSVLGFTLQSTNGQLWGDRNLALSDSRLAGNFKFNELDSPNFDFTESYLRAELADVGVQFGREFCRIGLGYSDRLILSDNAPAFDFFRITYHYKSFRFTFLHGALLGDEMPFTGVPNLAPHDANKYLALHRFQFSLFRCANVGISEMVIYQRLTPEYAYLNPINFFKSAEHQLRDRDNAFLGFDLEVFPADGYKLYGSWLIDDIFFSKIGTGWWGNEFGWQGGLFAANVLGADDIDAVVEYTRIEPYVYSNRLSGNNYTHGNIELGHHLDPNSDEWFFELRYRPGAKLRLYLNAREQRHGANITVGDSLVFNAGGSAFQGHRDIDGETAPFLAGDLQKVFRAQARARFEFMTNFFLDGILEFRHARDTGAGATRDDVFASAQFSFAY
jgi:Capsule assembly protein Wzi